MTSEKLVFEYSLIIKEQHLDTFGHVNNAAYLVLLEEARWDLITSRGYGLKTILQTGKGPVILEYNMKFIKELKLRQKISIRSSLLSYERKVATLAQDIYNERNELCFEGKMTFGLFDTKERKLVEPSEEWLHAIGAGGSPNR